MGQDKLQHPGLPRGGTRSWFHTDPLHMVESWFQFHTDPLHMVESNSQEVQFHIPSTSEASPDIIRVLNPVLSQTWVGKL